jgi:hypothetical protein
VRAIWMYECLFRNRNRQRDVGGLRCELAEYQAGMRWDVELMRGRGKEKRVRRPEQLILPAQSCLVKEDEVVPGKEEGSNVVLCL